jgi:hypothetical protein
MTSEQLVNNFMNYSQYGALSPMFVMQAIETLADQVIAQKKELLKADKKDKEAGKVSIVNITAWIGVAEEIKGKLVNNRK